MSDNDTDSFERLFVDKYNCHWPFARYEAHLTGKSSEKQLNKDVTVL